MPVDLFYFLSWLGFIGLGGVKIPVDSFCLLSLLGWGGVKIPADLFCLLNCLGFIGWVGLAIPMESFVF